MAFDGAAILTVDFVARLVALVPKSRVNLTRYHGVPAPSHRWRGKVTPARRGKGVMRISNDEVRSPAERHAAMTWAQRLKRVFNIDIDVCSRCGGSVRVIADASDRSTEDQANFWNWTILYPLITERTRSPRLGGSENDQ